MTESSFRLKRSQKVKYSNAMLKKKSCGQEAGGGRVMSQIFGATTFCEPNYK